MHGENAQAPTPWNQEYVDEFRRFIHDWRQRGLNLADVSITLRFCMMMLRELLPPQQVLQGLLTEVGIIEKHFTECEDCQKTMYGHSPDREKADLDEHEEAEFEALKDELTREGFKYGGH